MVDTNGNDLTKLVYDIADNIPALLGYWDKDLICRYANEAYIIWFGKSPGELIGKFHIKDLLGSLLYSKNLHYINGAMAGGEQVFTRQILLPSGILRNTLATYKPDWREGKVVGIFVHVADITAMEEFRSNASDNGNNKSRGVNPLNHVIETLQACVLTGFPGINRLAKKHFISESKLKRDFRKTYNSSLFAYYRVMQMELAERLLSSKDYSKKQVAALLRFSNPANFSACFNKYLRNKIQQQKIDPPEQNNNRYLTYVTQATFSIAMFDSNLVYMATSQAWRTEKNIGEENLVGKNLYESFPYLEPKWRDIYNYCLNDNIMQCDEEQFILPDGTEKWSKWNIRPWYSSLNTVGGLLITTEDITDIKLKQIAEQRTLRIFKKTSEIARIGTWKKNFVSGNVQWDNITAQILNLGKDFKPERFNYNDIVDGHEDRKLFADSINDAIANGKPFDIMINLLIDGKYRKQVRIIGYPEFTNNECSKLYGTIQELKVNHPV